MGSSLGSLFRISTFGESHGVGVGVIVDGCPPGIKVEIEDVQRELDRRRPGQSAIVTQRKESDTVRILSGLEDGISLGTPIAMLVMNEDQRSRDYDEMKTKYRPSHADFAYDQKFGLRASSGGGRASARETIGRVAAGAIAKIVLKHQWQVRVTAFVERVQDIRTDIDPLGVTEEMVEANIIRCPDPEVAQKMITRVEEARKDGDSVGGSLICVAHGVPAGWGDPVFDKLEADLAKAAMSLPACKAIEVGSGFEGTFMTGFSHHDAFVVDEQKNVRTRTNFSGGIQGGISNGMPIVLRAGFKPTATIMKTLDTVTVDHEPTTLQGRGRHDPCVLPRAVPMLESMVALVLVDHALRQRAIL